MFIIPVAGMTKALMAVTISLHPAAHHAQASYTVLARQGIGAWPVCGSGG